MDPATIAAAGSGVQILASVIAELMSQGKRDEAERMMQGAAQMYNIPLPELQAGVDQTLNSSAMQNVNGDGAGRDAQQRALDQLSNVQAQGGLQLQDRAALNDIQSGVAQQERASRGRILDSMRQRGMGGSGAELAAMLSSGQAGADRASKEGLGVAAQAQRRAYEAIMDRGRMGGDVRGQDFNERARAAEAQDRIAEYNAQARERGTHYRNQIAQQNYGNQMGRADQQAGERRRQAGAILSDADRQREMIAGIGRGVGAGVSAYGSSGMSKPGIGEQSPNPYQSYAAADPHEAELMDYPPAPARRTRGYPNGQ